MLKVFEYALYNDVTIILTSHSMEECEMLCSRIGIMSKGQFECLGNIQDLKKKFGNIYSVDIKINSNYIEDLFNYLKDKIKIKFHYETESNFIFQVDHLTSPKQLFYLIEQIKQQFYIETYSIQQMTLEQLFLFLQNSN